MIIARERAFARIDEEVSELFIVSNGYFAYMMIRYHINVEPICANTIYVKAATFDHRCPWVSMNEVTRGKQVRCEE